MAADGIAQGLNAGVSALQQSLLIDQTGLQLAQQATQNQQEQNRAIKEAGEPQPPRSQDPQRGQNVDILA